MQRIIAGRFQSKDHADAAALLLEQYIAKTEIRIFHNNFPGRHDASIPGGGALQGLGDADGKPHALVNRPGGVILSVRIADPAIEERVIGTLRAEDAADIEQAEGEWLDGDWVDFDPVTKPRWVKKQAIKSVRGSGARKLRLLS